METDAVATPGEAEGNAGGRPSAARLLLRFSVGLTSLAGERLLAGLRALDEGRVPIPQRDAPLSIPALGPRHAVLGALLAVPEALARAAARVAPAADRLRRLARGGRRVLDRLPGRALAVRRVAAWRARAVRDVGRLSVEGHAEEIAGRALAREAVRTVVRNASALVAESPDVKRVIQEQSQGLAVSAITSLRTRTARADSVIESAARRLLGRRRAGRP
jgi:hypothetical protein